MSGSPQRGSERPAGADGQTDGGGELCSASRALVRDVGKHRWGLGGGERLLKRDAGIGECRREDFSEGRTR